MKFSERYNDPENRMLEMGLETFNWIRFRMMVLMCLASDHYHSMDDDEKEAFKDTIIQLRDSGYVDVPHSVASKIGILPSNIDEN